MHCMTFVIALLSAIYLAFTPSDASAGVNKFFDHSLSIYSTYPSVKLVAQCKAQHEADDKACVEDSITTEKFLDALNNLNAFVKLVPFEDGGDYELLIANVGSVGRQSAEFILRWRGFEVSDTRFTLVKHNLSNNDAAEALVNMWFEKVTNEGIFSNAFLFSALKASDYLRDLQVPEKIGKFTKLDTQLYADPFNGAITRYSHAQFDDALIDVTVYPFLATLSASDDDLLGAQLQADVQEAKRAAKRQSLTLSHASPASPYHVNNNVSGWRIGLKADSSTLPTIYATIYVFRQGDKIVKISTTFPVHLSDPIANELIALIRVPQESVLMKNIRQLL